MIEIKYEVYRFHKWWEVKIKKDYMQYFEIKDVVLQALLEKEAFERDLWTIRNLTYKYISND